MTFKKGYKNINFCKIFVYFVVLYIYNFVLDLMQELYNSLQSGCRGIVVLAKVNLLLPVTKILCVPKYVMLEQTGTL